MTLAIATLWENGMSFDDRGWLACDDPQFDLDSAEVSAEARKANSPTKGDDDE